MYGPILFIGGVADNNLLELSWAERVKVRTPLGLPVGVKIVPEPEVEQAYRLEGFTTERGAIFYCYLLETLTSAEVYERIDLPPYQAECEFQVPEWELHKRLGVPKEVVKERLVR